MAGLSTNAPGLWGGFAGLLYGSTSLSTPPGFLADATPAWVLPGAALDLDFADSLGYNSRNLATTTPDSILTYTSPSPKMVYGSDGVLGYAPHNLCFQSEAFATSPWADTIGGTGVAPTVTADAGNDPNGNPTADRIQFSLAGGTAITDISRRRQSITVIATPHTFSVYLRSYDGSSTYNMHITDPSGSTRNIVVTGSWQRFEVSATATGSAATYAVGIRGGQIPANSNTADVLAWGAQLNRGSSALTYVPTTTAAVYSLPIDHDPVTFDPLGVLIEEQRTNLLINSEDLNGWAITTNNTLTLNATTAPNGVVSADLITRTTTAAAYRGATGLTKAASSIQYTYTIFAKKSVDDYLSVTVQSSASNRASAAFNLNTGVVGATAVVGAYTIQTTAMEELENGWYRCELTFTTDTSTALSSYVIPRADNTAPVDSVDSSSTSACYLWGAQLEVGAFPTSYIPTVASQVTRAADQVSILTSAFGYSATAGTVAVDVTLGQGGSGFALFDDGTANNQISTGATPASGFSGFFVKAATIVQADIFAGSTVAPGANKQAAAWQANDFTYYTAGVQRGTPDVSGSIPTVTTLKLGIDRLAYLNGRIKRLTYFPTRRTNADLQVLTT